MVTLRARVGLRGTMVLCAVVWVLLASRAAAEPRAPSAEEVKAAFLYHFGKFVVWPNPAFRQNGMFVIGVLGDATIADALDRTVRDKQVQDRRIDIRRLRSAKEAPGCQILFIGIEEREHLGAALDAVEGASVLTVSDIDDFVDKGGMISLLLDQNRVRFEVNLRPVEQAGLKVSSQLLKLARRVVPPG